MAIERIRPIVDAAGDPFYVVERDYIGAEHANAQAAWTRNTRPVLTREHNAEGQHDHFPIPRAAIEGYIMRGSGGVGTVWISPRSRLMDYRHAEGPDDPDPWALEGLISGAFLGNGWARIFLGVPLPPTLDYGLINLTPGRVSPRPTGVALERCEISIQARHTNADFEILRNEGGSPTNGWFCFLLVA